MRLSVLIGNAALCAIASFANYTSKPAPKSNLGEFELFNKWAQLHNKNYDSPKEKQYRLGLFFKSLAKVILHNKQKLSWTIGLNQFSDMTIEEVRAKHFGLKKRENTAEEEEKIEWSHLTGTPSNGVDWTAAGAVTPVKDQGQCGSCWAFSSTGALEGLDFIHNKPTVVNSYSEQQLVDCSTAYGNEGCNGGDMPPAFKYVRDHGIATEASYPYKGKDQKCQSKVGVFKVSSYKKVPPKSMGALAHACDSQPISVSIDAEGILQYKEGVFSDASCGTDLNHGVLLTGYDDQAWFVKNSWSDKWGEKGYIRFSKSAVPDKQGGICGILLDNSYPILQ